MVNNYCPECKIICIGPFCRLCGERSIAAIIKCPHCENEVTILCKFCEFCGKPIQEEIKEHIAKERGGEKVGDAV